MTDLTWFDAVLGFCVVIVYGAWLGALISGSWRRHD